jgi:uncharacterized membrane protein YsdA (DUF1294 family)
MRCFSEGRAFGDRAFGKISSMITPHILISIFVTSNLFSFIMMARDKRKSIRGNGLKRTPEGIIFFLATAFGSIGVYLGMLTFRHKTQKWYFQIGIPLLILQNLVTLYLVSEMFDIR